jgi:hypothetical protein
MIMLYLHRKQLARRDLEASAWNVTTTVPQLLLLPTTGRLL